MKIDGNRSGLDHAALQRLEKAAADTPKQAVAPRSATAATPCRCRRTRRWPTTLSRLPTTSPDVRTDLVERMRALLAAGELGNDAGPLADSLIDSMHRQDRRHGPSDAMTTKTRRAGRGWSWRCGRSANALSRADLERLLTAEPELAAALEAVARCSPRGSTADGAGRDRRGALVAAALPAARRGAARVHADFARPDVSVGVFAHGHGARSGSGGNGFGRRRRADVGSEGLDVGTLRKPRDGGARARRAAFRTGRRGAEHRQREHARLRTPRGAPGGGPALREAERGERRRDHRPARDARRTARAPPAAGTPRRAARARHRPGARDCRDRRREAGRVG